MTTMIKILAVLSVGFIICVLFMFGIVQTIEGYNSADPGIDTHYAEKFDEAKYKSIVAGMDTAQVIALIGAPLSIQDFDDGSALWYYTSDGKAWPEDYAWLGREIMFDSKGKVEYLNMGVHYD